MTHERLGRHRQADRQAGNVIKVPQINLPSLDICVKEAILGEFLVEVIEDVEVILEVELDSVLDEGGAAVAGAGEAGNGKEREKGDD